MVTKNFRSAFLSLLVGGWTFQAALADEVAASGRQFLFLSQGARESAMGGSFAAVSDDAEGLYCNPAAMTQLPNGELSLSHLSWIGRTNEESLAYVQPLNGMGTLGGGLSLYWVPAFDNTGGLENAFSPLTYQGVLSYGTPFRNPLVSNLFLGGSLKVAGSSFGSLEQTDDLSLDLGLFYRTAWKPLRLGVVAENISLLSDAASLPALSLRAGASIRDDRGLLALEVVRIMDQNFQFQLGGEVWLKNVLAFRAGFRSADAPGSFPGISLGVGLKVGSAYRLDYAASTMGDLGLVQWISLGIIFSPPESAAGKPAFLPLASSPTPAREEPASAYQTAKAALPKGTIPNLAKPYRKSFDIFQKALATVPAESGNLPIPKSYKGIQGFPIDVNVVNNSVEIDWKPQTFEDNPAVGYNVYVSIVPGANLKKLNDKPISETHWSTEVGLHGMTYYFLIKAVGPDGVEIKSSVLKDVLLQ